MIKEPKPKVGEYYYYAKSMLKMKCIEVGHIQSKFTDYKKRKYQFYNYDMFRNKWKLKRKFN